MTCRGLCDRYKTKKPADGSGRYASGQKRCQECEIYIEWQGLSCPCCSMRLRTKPRNLKYKNKFKEAIKENGVPSIGVDYNALKKQAD